ncbi:nitroreductase family deazaflavin-dependent oxidoreductase [Spongiactinospora sp. TRM90649]|uniref:nitroreductase family deazaflavin-dependent oxidoreductase n=1 Tax=Spongiactinospora sp. TRM90649 TaxID=3031114 RepID=UPI0023F802E2|nr:nitroreductase family deazaflavin-dependent oxidoreductase [Spongiactinospora sp. TRM90649]MDF5753069.1 nitroreductase family deazaflavin-dependent oxidoreductase [Spongiactinospora sp. TRM90649]
MDTKPQRKQGTPGAFSRWTQHRANARMNRKIRRGKATFMGMDVLILNTVGRLSGQPRETPVAFFPDVAASGGEDSWLIVASGGGSLHPDWHANLMANPGQVTIEVAGRGTLPVTPHRLDGSEREQAWQVIAAAQPRIAKYQAKSTRQYPVIRLSAR